MNFCKWIHFYFFKKRNIEKEFERNQLQRQKSLTLSRKVIPKDNKFVTIDLGN